MESWLLGTNHQDYEQCKVHETGKDGKSSQDHEKEKNWSNKGGLPKKVKELAGMEGNM